ncbi:hypothetical protein T01_7925 [Trichinella spiralis]|uniref:Uncharacterized protein n=1 Tax=Trichinella spiralis TaxID=6334 RepID=A0A0V1ALA3_TRISP|nr:hypothetical protein T01_12437 [Trichinella spiralis]KRY25084.1 hypothetical protein T01_7925 [Trichinella spiralis]
MTYHVAQSKSNTIKTQLMTFLNAMSATPTTTVQQLLPVFTDNRLHLGIFKM